MLDTNICNRMAHQIELHLSGQMIQYELSEVQKIPSWHSFVEGKRSLIYHSLPNQVTRA
jgi:hypothetical protein